MISAFVVRLQGSAAFSDIEMLTGYGFVPTPTRAHTANGKGAELALPTFGRTVVDLASPQPPPGSAAAALLRAGGNEQSGSALELEYPHCLVAALSRAVALGNLDNALLRAGEGGAVEALRAELQARLGQYLTTQQQVCLTESGYGSLLDSCFLLRLLRRMR
eukprot:SAG11_NODE_416_length_9669_cov_7.135528_15_plen_162_part_00